MNGLLAALKEGLEAGERWLGRVPEVAALAGGSWLLAGAAALVGVVLLVAGVRLGRALSGAAGAGVGAIAATTITGMIGSVGVPHGAVTWVAAAVVGAGSALAPPLYPILLGALPGALLGLRVPVAGQPWLGAAAGATVLALLAFALRRLVMAGTAAVAGAVLLAAALIALAPRVPALAFVAGQPVLLVALAAVLAVAGTAYQLERRPGGGRGRGDRDGGGGR